MHQMHLKILKNPQISRIIFHHSSTHCVYDSYLTKCSSHERIAIVREENLFGLELLEAGDVCLCEYSEFHLASPTIHQINWAAHTHSDRQKRSP